MGIYTYTTEPHKAKSIIHCFFLIFFSGFDSFLPQCINKMKIILETNLNSLCPIIISTCRASFCVLLYLVLISMLSNIEFIFSRIFKSLFHRVRTINRRMFSGILLPEFWISKKYPFPNIPCLCLLSILQTLNKIVNKPYVQ